MPPVFVDIAAPIAVALGAATWAHLTTSRIELIKESETDG